MSTEKIVAAVEGLGKQVADFKSEIEARLGKIEKQPATDNVRSLITGPATPEQRKVLQAENRREAAELYARGADPFEGRGRRLGTFLRVVAAHKRGVFPGLSVVQISEKLGGADFAGIIEKHERALGESIFGEGGAVVPEVLAAEMIEFLRAASVLSAVGMRSIPMPGGNLTIPRMTDGSTAYYTAENEAGTVSQPDTGQRRLSAKKLMAIVPTSNELIADAPAFFDLMLRDDLARAVASRKDLAGIRGSGVSDEPTGIKNLIAAANSIAATAGSTPSVATVDDEISQIVGAVEDANIPLVSPCFLMHPRSKRYLADLRDGAGNYLYRAEINSGMFRGAKLGVTTNVPKNLGSGDDSEIYFGDAAQLLEGDTLGMQVEFFENGAWSNSGTIVSGISSDQSVFRAKSRHDFQLRHPEAFAMLTGVEWGA